MFIIENCLLKLSVQNMDLTWFLRYPVLISKTLFTDLLHFRASVQSTSRELFTAVTFRGHIKGHLEGHLEKIFLRFVKASLTTMIERLKPGCRVRELQVENMVNRWYTIRSV